MIKFGLGVSESEANTIQREERIDYFDPSIVRVSVRSTGSFTKGEHGYLIMAYTKGSGSDLVRGPASRL